MKSIKRRLILMVMFLSTLILLIGELIQRTVPMSVRRLRSRNSYGKQSLSYRRSRLKLRTLSGKLVQLSRRLVAPTDDIAVLRRVKIIEK